MDLFGKKIGDLQENIAIGEDAITGTLNYIADYSGFSGDPSETSGNYLVLHATSDDGATISVTVTNPVTLEDDGIVVLRIRDKDSQTVTVVASKDGYATTTKVYSLTGLICNTQNG